MGFSEAISVHDALIDTPNTGATETIGSRLRKRRRTNSSPTKDTSPAPKRTQSKKAAPATRQRRQAKSSDQDAFTSTEGSVPHTQNQDVDLEASPARGADPMLQAEGQGSTSPPQGIFGSPTQVQGGPDFNTVIADIIDHGDRVDTHYASRGYNAMGSLENGHLGASFTLKTQSLPVLENLVGFPKSMIIAGH